MLWTSLEQMMYDFKDFSEKELKAGNIDFEKIIDDMYFSAIPFSLVESGLSMKIIKSCNRATINEDFRKKALQCFLPKGQISYYMVLEKLYNENFALSNYCLKSQRLSIRTDDSGRLIECDLYNIVHKKDNMLLALDLIYSLELGGAYIYGGTFIIDLNHDRKFMFSIELMDDRKLNNHINEQYNILAKFRNDINTKGEFNKRMIRYALINSASVLHLNMNLLDKKPIFKKRRYRDGSTKCEVKANSKPKKKEYNLSELSTKIIYTEDTVIHESFRRKEYTRKSDGWEVQGHWRNYKSGKRVWIPAFDKGEKVKGKIINIEK